MKAPTPILLFLSLFLLISSGCKNNSSDKASDEKVVTPVVPTPPPAPEEPVPAKENTAICGNPDFDLIATLKTAAKNLSGN